MDLIIVSALLMAGVVVYVEGLSRFNYKFEHEIYKLSYRGRHCTAVLMLALWPISWALFFILGKR